MKSKKAYCKSRHIRVPICWSIYIKTIKKFAEWLTNKYNYFCMKINSHAMTIDILNCFCGNNDVTNPTYLTCLIVQWRQMLQLSNLQLVVPIQLVQLMTQNNLMKTIESPMLSLVTLHGSLSLLIHNMSVYEIFFYSLMTTKQWIHL